MKPGPKPKTNEEKRRIGNPGGRPLPELSEVAHLEPVAVADPPRPLGRYGRETWDRLLRSGRAWTAESDLDALLMLCEMVDERIMLRQNLLNNLDVGYDPALARRQGQLEKSIAALLSELGYTPASRTGLGVAEVVLRTGVSKLDELEQRRKAKRAG